MLYLVSCGSGAGDSGFKKSLKEQPVGETGHFISLPVGYKLRSTQGPDFTVYYFLPADSLQSPEYSGGMYFGWHPSLFGPQYEPCDHDSLTSPALGADRQWQAYQCNDTLFFIETIVNAGEDMQIHLFGHALHEKNRNKLLDIYSTFREK